MTEKHLNCYINVYGGQKCTPLLHSFANNVVHVHLQKIALNMPSEHCNHYRSHLHDSIPTPLTLSPTYLLHGASTVSSQLSIISLSLHISYPVPWGKTNCQLHKSQNYCLRTLLGFLAVPKELVYDRDPRFTAHLWRELCHILGTKTSASTAFHPQSDGQSERTNRTFEQILRAHIHNKPLSAWLDALPFTEFAINSTISQSTGYSPFFMLYGQEVPLPFDHALANPSDGTMQPATESLLKNIAQNATARLYTAKAIELVKNNSKLHSKCTKKNAKSIVIPKNLYYDSKHKLLQFQIGDAVLFSSQNLAIQGPRKLAARFVGPFHVICRIGP